ncbi:MAG TPA: tryptophan halogenase family protein [Rudaea sp.]|nr:tryptophan halogenase family protein [Rudaea sp.]
MGALRNILIVGGGTAGWLTACYLARTVNAAQRQSIQITLVESADIGILGVGEGTFPSLRGTLAAIGMDEAHFVRGANATFKQGIRFVDWVRSRDAAGAHHYFHPFSLPSQQADGPELLPYWLLGAADDTPFADAVTMQARVIDAKRGPKRIADPPYQARLNYAYHFDAAKFATVLAEHGRALGVRHVIATVEDAELDGGGAIACVRTREAGTLSADLYVDCTGFRAALIGRALGSPFRSAKDVLFVDRAVAMQVPYPVPDAPIASCTISTAHEAGWTWDIGLKERRGIGYVYSSRHTDDTRAEQVLRGYIGPAADNLTPRLLKFEAGHRPLQWVRNCVAVGLSAGFVEPLESTGIGLIEIAAYMIAHLLPADGEMARTARHFNRLMDERFLRIYDFIKMHYALSRRRDSRFWIDNTDSASIPESLADRLATWRCRPPHRLDFVTDVEMFLPSSWQYILYGMEYDTDLAPMRSAYPQIERARREFSMLRAVAAHAVNDLPDHRALVEHVCAHGFASPPAAADRRFVAA